MRRKLAIPAFLIAVFASLALPSCQDEVSPIGSSVANGDVTISVDSATFNLHGSTIEAVNIDARSLTCLLGHINVPEYGELSAAYVTQMLAASNLQIPDSIGVDRVDSLKLAMLAPRSYVIGDTLAPQQARVYNLTKNLNINIKSDFDPLKEGYYDPQSPIAIRNYTLSMIAMGDSTFRNSQVFRITTPLPKQWGIDLFKAYRNNPEAFQWPETLNQYFKGVYVDPAFGRGAIANIQATCMYLYYHHFVTRSEIVDDVAVSKRVAIKDSICLLSSAPEVISSSVLNYTPSQNIKNLIASGKQIITAPLGYQTGFRFPVEDILKEYWASDVNLVVINNLTLTIPVSSISNDYGLTPPPTLLMILRKDVDEFFNNGKVPDNKVSFQGTYSSANGRYEFSSMRQYIVDLKNKQGNISADDLEFVLIPVEMQTETVSNYDGTTTTYITSCTPYLQRPSMAELHTERAQLVFTFTKQLMK